MKTLIYDITNKCNLRCSHCYNSDYFESNKKRVNPLTIAKRCNELQFDRIHLVGGEPFCEKSLFEFVEMIKNSKISINTNGLLLDNDTILKVLSSDKIDQITISVDATNAIDYEHIRRSEKWDELLGNIQNLITKKREKKSDLTVNIAFVITKENVNKIKEMYDLTKEISADNLLLSQLFIEGNAKKNCSHTICGKDFAYKILNQLMEIDTKKNVNVYLDAKPIFLLWLKMKGVDLELNMNAAKCSYRTGMIYCDSYGNFYACSPYSKVGNAFFKYNEESEIVVKRINEFNRILEKTNELKEKCIGCLYESICDMCFANTCSYTDFLCLYAKNEISKEIFSLKNKMIILNDSVTYDSSTNMLINFKEMKTHKIKYLNSIFSKGKTTNQLSNEQLAELSILRRRNYLHVKNI